MNADGSNRVELAEGYYPQWSPDGEKIAFIRSEVLSRRADPGDIVQIFHFTNELR